MNRCPTRPAAPLVPQAPRRTPARPALAAVALLTAMSLGACSDPGSASDVSGGTVVMAVNADVDYLVPALSATQQGQVVAELLFDRLADIGDNLNTVGDQGFRPRLARSWSWSADSLSIAFTLDARARWHDGRPVRATDVRFTWRLYADTLTGAPFAPLLANIDSVTERDSLTAVFWFHRRSPEQFFDATYQMLVHPEHLLRGVPHDQLRTAPFGLAPVGTGRFRFVRREPGMRLEIASDTGNYAGRARLDRVIFSVTRDYQAGVNRLLTREVDVLDNLRPETMAGLGAHPELRAVPYPALTYAFLQFALRDGGTSRPHRLFGDLALRRALLRAIDRKTLLRSVFDSLATIPLAPAPTALVPADTGLGQAPFDPALAAHLLDSLGWVRTGPDGLRQRGAVPLRFSVMVPSPSRNRVRYATLMQEQLRTAGVQVDIETLEPAVFSDRLKRRAFDAVLNSVNTDPTPVTSLRQSWGGGAAARDGSNRSSYVNPAFDAIVDSAAASMSPAAARAHIVRAYRVINADVPAIWLYEPRQVAAVHTRLQLPRLRATGWLSGLADWSIPPAQRIARDRMAAAPKP
ncbi:MAG: peptide ABC transporter substrate-binding protein [Gemmatimonadetes bacterium]|nr:peptide ABC transporter substrate-binding protein [Gemmatimonadota bacterium]